MSAPHRRGRRRRISFVADSDAWGGAEVCLAQLIRHAGALGWSASLVCAEPVAPGFTGLLPADRVAVVPVARGARRAPAVAAALRRQAPDAVLVNLVDPGSNAAAVEAALATAPTAATLHLGGDTGTGQRRRRLTDLYSDLAVLLTSAGEIRSQVLAELACPKAGVHVVRNGVEVPTDPRGAVHADPPRVGVHARLTEQKGLDVLLAAVSRLVRDGERLDVVIGGTGRDESRLRTAAAGLPVTFAGFVHDARRFLSGLDLFCLPSRREALPLSLLEAMAEGLPCVATDVGEVRAALGGAVLLVPPERPEALAAALRAALRDDALRARLAATGRRRVAQRHTAWGTAQRTYAVLDSALDATAATA